MLHTLLTVLIIFCRLFQCYSFRKSRIPTIDSDRSTRVPTRGPTRRRARDARRRDARRATAHGFERCCLFAGLGTLCNPTCSTCAQAQLPTRAHSTRGGSESDLCHNLLYSDDGTYYTLVRRRETFDAARAPLLHACFMPCHASLHADSNAARYSR